MVDVLLFTQSEKVEEALRNHSCKECLQWCSENRSSLKKQNVGGCCNEPMDRVLIYLSPCTHRARSNSICDYKNTSSWQEQAKEWRLLRTPKSTCRHGNLPNLRGSSKQWHY